MGPVVNKQDSAQTTNPTSATSSFEFTLKPWKQPTEFERFEELAKQLVHTPKSADRVTQ